MLSEHGKTFNYVETISQTIPTKQCVESQFSQIPQCNVWNPHSSHKEMCWIMPLLKDSVPFNRDAQHLKRNRNNQSKKAAPPFCSFSHTTTTTVPFCRLNRRTLRQQCWVWQWLVRSAPEVSINIVWECGKGIWLSCPLVESDQRF